MDKKSEYRYEGGVKHFDTLVASKWVARTFATTEKKAIANLVFQFKKTRGMVPATRVTLTGKPVKVETSE